MLELGRSMHSEAQNYRGVSYNEEKVAAMIKGLMDGDGVVFLYESGGAVLGGIAGQISEFWFSTERIASDLALFVCPESRSGMIAVKLVLAFQNWARLMGAQYVQMGITTGEESRSGKLYLSLGFEPSGSIYKKALSS